MKPNPKPTQEGLLMIQTWPIKRKTHLDREVVKALSDDLGLDAEAAARLRGVASHDDDDDGVLEEASIAR